jgi:serine/threonine-protein kinase
MFPAMTTGPLGTARLVGGRYVLEAPIGRGGMGEVWRAEHVALRAPVAIKFLQGASAESETSRRRFLTEARVTASLKSRHAVQVFDYGVTDDGIPYLVMELLEGETLERRIARLGRLPVAATAALLQKAARALERAHALGIVHRDFKPENVMLVPDAEDGGEAVKVVDFGIAKLIGGLEDARGSAHNLTGPRAGRSPESFSVTSTGMGTPFYMAPEQVNGGGSLGPAVDIWAFGVVAFECLTGKKPFEGDNVGKLLLRVLAGEPHAPASSLAPVPGAFDAWFRVACARRPDDRFRDVQTAAAALVLALEPPAIGDPPALNQTPGATSIERPSAPEGAPAPPEKGRPPETVPPPSRDLPVLAIAAVLAAVAAGLAVRAGVRPAPTRVSLTAPAQALGETPAPTPPPDPTPAALQASEPSPPPSPSEPVRGAPPPRASASSAPAAPARPGARRLPPLGL